MIRNRGPNLVLPGMKRDFVAVLDPALHLLRMQHGGVTLRIEGGRNGEFLQQSENSGLTELKTDLVVTNPLTERHDIRPHLGRKLSLPVSKIGAAAEIVERYAQHLLPSLCQL